MVARTYHGRRFVPGLAVLVLISASAMAEEGSSANHSASARLQADDADSRQISGEIELPIGEHAWGGLMIGASELVVDDEQTDLRTAAAAAGVSAGSFAYDARLAYWTDGEAFEQWDLSASMTFHARRYSIGLDAFYRSAEDETWASYERRRRDPLLVVVEELVEGVGIGLHGHFSISQALVLYVSGMTYDYDDSSGEPFALRLRELDLSGVTRYVAFLEDTVTAGIAWQLAPVWLTLDYIRDRALDAGVLTHTFELRTDIPIIGGWSIVPMVGYSATDGEDDVAFGAVELHVMW